VLFSSHSVDLLQRGVPPMEYSPLQTAPAWVCSMRYSPSGTDCSSAVPRGLQFLPENLFLLGLSTGFSILQGISTCCNVGSCTGCSVDISSTINLHGLQGENLCHHSLLQGLQRNLFSGTWITCFPSVISGLAGLVKCKTKDKTRTEASLDSGVKTPRANINWTLANI